MRMQIAVIASVVLLTGAMAAAQTPTAAGVDAFLRGDYNTAAGILKPLAERTFERDYAAEFFMASMYESGRGVPVDLVRACALYLRSASGSPFEDQGTALWRATRKRLTSDQADDCTFSAAIGINHGFQSTTFTLESDHWVAWTVRGAAVTYKGKERRVETAALRGSRFYPVQYTELAVGPTRSVRRHFMELFAWVPTAPRQWDLMWQLFEVVREELIPIASNVGVLATIHAEEPPLGDMSDVRRLAAVRTTDTGDAELAIIGGTTPRTVLIETVEEREEAQRVEAARIEARKKVDVKREFDVRRPPSFTYSDVQGCGGLIVHAWSDDRAEAIEIFANRESLGLSATPKQFDVFPQPERLEIRVHVYERAAASPFCTHMVPPRTNEEIWRAVGGRVTIDLVPVAARVHTPASDRVTIRIDGAVFVNSAGVRVTVTRPLVLTTTLGGWGG